MEDGRGLRSSGRRIATSNGCSTSPGKLFAAQDPVLGAHVRAAEAEACYESLSLLYVAMTRAKRAMLRYHQAPRGNQFPAQLSETTGRDARRGKHRRAGGKT